jgi:hypothetical protein
MNGRRYLLGAAMLRILHPFKVVQQDAGKGLDHTRNTVEKDKAEAEQDGNDYQHGVYLIGAARQPTAKRAPAEASAP